MVIEIICPNCNFSKKVPEEKIPGGVNRVKCPQCNESFEFAPPDYDTGFKEEYTSPPLERESAPRFPQGLYETFKSVLFTPKEFFSKMERAEGLKEPLAFGLLFGSIGTMFAIFWQFLLMRERLLSLTSDFLDQPGLSLVFIGILVITPLFVVLNIFITGGIIHLFLIIARADKGHFEGTLKVIAYSQAARILAFIPFIGGLVGWLWNLIIVTIGLREIHGASYLKIVVVILFILFLKALMLLSLLFIRSMILLGSFAF